MARVYRFEDGQESLRVRECSLKEIAEWIESKIDCEVWVEHPDSSDLTLGIYKPDGSVWHPWFDTEWFLWTGKNFMCFRTSLEYVDYLSLHDSSIDRQLHLDKI